MAGDVNKILVNESGVSDAFPAISATNNESAV